MKTRKTSWRALVAWATLSLVTHTFAQMSQQTLWSFGVPGQSVASPQGPLVQGPDGALYGTTAYGIAASTNDDSVGPGAGTVFKMNPDGTGFSILYYFPASPSYGQNPVGGLLLASDGLLYGLGRDESGFGMVFRLHTDGTGFAAVGTLDLRWNAASPVAGLLEGRDGALYGMARGTFEGLVFKLNRDGTGLTALQTLNTESPTGPLVQDQDGVLYGATREGEVFRLNPDGTGFAVLRTLSASEGTDLEGGLALGADGALYGTAGGGGSNNVGAVFKLGRDGNGFALLHSFGSGWGDGQGPAAGLILGQDGALYGTTVAGGIWRGGGTVFRVTGDGSNFSILYRFTSTGGDAQNPLTPVLQGVDGALYGTTANGGTGDGTVYRLNTDGTGYAVVKRLSLSGGDAYKPGYNLILASDRRLYGTASGGGGGALFGLNRDGTGYALLHRCSDATNDFDEPLTLLQGADGALYGTTSSGGDNGAGTVFKLNLDGTGFALLHSFTNTAGGLVVDPNNLLQAGDGVLYGTTYAGGAQDHGTVFRLNPDGTGFAVLHSFGIWEPRYPQRGLVQGPDGALYGTTLYTDGGPVPATVFRLNTDGSGYTSIHTFGMSPGDTQSPQGTLILGRNGALYGIIWGAIFTVKLDGTGYALLHSFSGRVGDQTPAAGLMQALDGMLYGTGDDGVMQVGLDGAGYALQRFRDGVSCPLVQEEDGVFYGTTETGGRMGSGTVFRLAYVLPEIVTPPQSQALALGANAVFFVRAWSLLPLDYQWRFNGAVLPGATNSAFSLTNVQPAQLGNYDVIIHDARGSATSVIATLSVIPPPACLPAIQVQPESRAVWAGLDVTLSAQCGSVEPWGAQWFLNGAPVPGATAPSLQLTNVGLGDAGNYQLVVTNACGSTTSAVAVLTVVSGQPAPITVCTEAALREAMRLGGHVTFACDGTISLAATITNLVETVLDGTGHSVTIRATNNTGLFYVLEASFTVRNLTLAEGQAPSGAAIFNDGGDLTLDGVRFLSNAAGSPANQSPLAPHAQGGAIYSRAGPLRAANCVFLGNTALNADQGMFGGGALCIESGQALLEGCLFSGNTAQGQSVNNRTFPAAGGAVHNSGGLSAVRCSFLGNSVSGGAGYSRVFSVSAGAIYNLGALDLARCTFASNSVTGWPGLLGAGGVLWSICNGGNGGQGTCANAGAIFNAGLASLVNDTFAWNSATAGNGGDGGDGCDSDYDGGAGGNGGDGGLAWGGALCDTNGATTGVTNCTFALNSATGGAAGQGGAGGGAFIRGPSGQNGQPGGNGSASAGGLSITGAPVNTLLAGNSPADQLADGAHNLESAMTTGIVGPLADNGGPTLTMALLPGSPAIGAADSVSAPPTDQRGFPRPTGTADIGAYEFGYPPSLAAVQLAEGGVDISVNGRADQVFWLFTSADLVNWTATATNSFGPSGIFLFHDPAAAAQTQRFYRAVMP